MMHAFKFTSTIIYALGLYTVILKPVKCPHVAYMQRCSLYLHESFSAHFYGNKVFYIKNIHIVTDIYDAHSQGHSSATNIQTTHMQFK